LASQASTLAVAALVADRGAIGHLHLDQHFGRSEIGKNCFLTTAMPRTASHEQADHRAATSHLRAMTRPSSWRKRL
jgi:hypothetical protein